MKNLKILSFLFFVVLVTVTVTSCKKDPEPIVGDALFAYDVDGYTITFTNTSTVEGTYAWNFGDSNTSTDENPVHSYAGKGEYTVGLTVTDENGDPHSISTTIAVDKASPVKLDDNSFGDWATVTGEGFQVTLGDTSGITKVAKFDYDAEFIYSYVEFEGNVADVFQWDMLVDYDNSIATGGISWIWPMSAADLLVEVMEFTTANSYTGVYDWTGTPGGAGWDWTENMTLPQGNVVIGHIGQVGNNVAIEIGMSRTKIPHLNNNAIGFGLFISNADWADVGYSPDKRSAASFFVLNMN
jgi:PKD repeat protein